MSGGAIRAPGEAELPTLVASHLTKSFGTRLAVTDVSLSVSRGRRSVCSETTVPGLRPVAAAPPANAESGGRGNHDHGPDTDPRPRRQVRAASPEVRSDLHEHSVRLGRFELPTPALGEEANPRTTRA